MGSLDLLSDETGCSLVTSERLCGACKMKHAHNPDTGKGVTGKGRKGLMLLMSQVETCEDSTGELWEVDDSLSGFILDAFRNALKDYFNLTSDCFRVNAVGCSARSVDNKHLIDAVSCCYNGVKEMIAEKKPRVILAFDSLAIRSYFGNRCHYSFEIDSWEGYCIPDFENNCIVIPCFGTYSLREHVIHKNGQYVKKDTFDLVIRAIRECCAKAVYVLEKNKPVVDFLTKGIKKLDYKADTKKILAFLRKIQAGDTVSFDYETSSSKPDFRNQFIKCVSVYSEKQDFCYSFLIDTRMDTPDLVSIRKEFTRILVEKDIKKIGQNIKHEDRWTFSKLGVRIKGWKWDTMLGSHFLNSNRSHVTGLKFQSSVNFGVFNYNEYVEKFFTIASGNIGKGDNTMNCIDAISAEHLLLYCGLDSIFTYWLYKKQYAKISAFRQTLKGAPSHMEGMEFLVASILAFSKMEQNGAFVSVPYLEKQKKDCKKKIVDLEEEFGKTELFKAWKKTFRGKTNINSGKQLGHMLYTVLKLNQKKKTESGEDSTDKEALLSLGVPDLIPYANMKLFQKVLGTYIAQLTREEYEGFVRASFNLHIVSSFRSSSNSPNLQNTPIRQKDIGIIIRGAYISRFGKNGIILEADLKGAEVSTSACYHKDKKFVEYVSSSKNDMHKDTMALVVATTPSEITKELRYYAKNKFVFPEFYGDWYDSCAEALWPEIQKLKLVNGTPVLLHLKDAIGLPLPKGYNPDKPLLMEDSSGNRSTPFIAFVEHMKEVEHKFWYDMFPEYTEWKNLWYRKYLAQGFVDSLTGFRYTGIMNRKQVINYPIQGSAYHLNQKGLNMMESLIRRKQLPSVLFNQIHDSQLYDCPSFDDAKEIVVKLNNIMNKRLREIYSWINVPIVVEFEMSEPGMSWFHKKPFDLKTMDFEKRG